MKLVPIVVSICALCLVAKIATGLYYGALFDLYTAIYYTIGSFFFWLTVFHPRPKNASRDATPAKVAALIFFGTSFVVYLYAGIFGMARPYWSITLGLFLSSLLCVHVLKYK
jgi:hypothetical protein